MVLTELLHERFGISEISPAALDKFTRRDYQKESELIEVLLESDPMRLDNRDILLWADNRTLFVDQHERLIPPLRRYFGKDYEVYVAARRLLYAAESSRPLDSLQKLFGFLKEHHPSITSGEQFATEFGDCDDFDEIMKKLEVHQRLIKGRLDNFYKNEKILLFDLREYSIMACRGFYEHQGGFCLSINDLEGELVYVSGWLHTNTKIISIHGHKPPEEGSTTVRDRMTTFKERTGVHPANLGVLMYLKFGEKLGHEEVKIRGSASPRHNQQGKKSPFYEIPRNYFRLKVDPSSGYYEFNNAQRDELLRKFCEKSGTINATLGKINDYLA